MIGGFSVTRFLQRALLGLLALGWAAAAATGDVASAYREQGEVRLECGETRLVLVPAAGGYAAQVQVLREASWEQVLAGTGPSGASLRLRYNLQDLRLPLRSVQITQVGAEPALEMTAAHGPCTVRVVARFVDGGRLLHFAVDLSVKGQAWLESLESEYRFRPGSPASTLIPLEAGWCPGQRLTGGNVIGDQAFSSPLAFMQHEQRMGALIADVTRIPANRLFKTAMRYHAGVNAGASGPWFSYGLMDYTPAGHVYFKHLSAQIYRVADRTLGYGYYLAVAGRVEPLEGHGKVARALWRLFGAPRAAAGSAPQYAPLGRCVRAAYDWAFHSAFAPLVWHEFRFGGLACGGTQNYVTFDRRLKGVATNRPGDDGIWFQSWFNNLRSAHGMFLMGVELSDPDLVRRARLIKNLVLTSPVDRGLFPVFFDVGREVHPVGGWRGGGPPLPQGLRPDDHYYHLPDLAWTGYWLVRWYRELESDPRVALRVKALADQLVALQAASGSVPTWVAKGTQKPAPSLRESASTAATALFWLEVYRELPLPAYLTAARRALAFLERDVIPEAKWWDFEVLASCTGPHLPGRDPDTGLHDAGTMSMIWAAEAFAAAHEITREQHFLELGRRVVDELCLYQHLHDKPWHFGIPAYGGFTSQNRDAEQNDARQAMVGPLLLHYYRLTGCDDYFQRGAAAIRAGFTNTYLPENTPVWRLLNVLFPWFGQDEHGFTEENTFHTGQPGAPWVMRASNFNWGPGSAAAGVAEAMLRHGGLYVDLARGKAFGLDGCTAVLGPPAVGGRQLTITERVGVARPILLLVEGVPAGKRVLLGVGLRSPLADNSRLSAPAGADGIISLRVNLAASLAQTFYLDLR